MKISDFYLSGNCYFAHMVTFSCNGGCPYCLVKGRGPTHNYSELPGSDIVNFWNGIEGHENKLLSLLGGECTLHKDFLEIIRGLKNYRRVTITTNVSTEFYDRPDFWKDLVVDYPLRINTTFHPTSGISPELYAERIFKMKENGVWVDQVASVDYPGLDREKYNKIFKKLGLRVKQITFLGFWTKESGFAKDIRPDTLWPNKTSDSDKIMKECGIDNIERYREHCGGTPEKRVQTECGHHRQCLLVAPDGTVHSCHFRLYYNINPLGNIFDGWEQFNEKKTCNFLSQCNFCDIVRIRKTGGYDAPKRYLGKDELSSKLF